MRRVRPDVSHRIRRQPSIFSVLWFRIALGVGVALVLALLVGPSLSSWFGADPPRSLFLLVPWGRIREDGSSPRAGGDPFSAEPCEPGVVSSDPTLGTVATTGKAPGAPADGHAARDGRAEGAGCRRTRAGRWRRRPTAPAAPSGVGPDDSARHAPAPSGSLAPPPAVYWVQVGAFLDHRNADRLVERLRVTGSLRRRRPSSRAVFSTGCSSWAGRAVA